MAQKVFNNIKLGAFVMAGLFLLILTLYIVGRNRNFFGSNFELRAHFHNVNGLMPGNNVRYSGIQVGTVKEVKMMSDTTIEVVMLINDKVNGFIHKNAVASIGTEGLIGNKIVNITPVKETAPVVADGDFLPAKKVLGTDEMLETLAKTNQNVAIISEDLKTTVHRIQNSTALWGILNESSLATDLKASLGNISQASARANAMMLDLHTIIADVKSGKGSVGALLTDTGFAINLEEAITKIKLVGDNANQLAGELNKTVQNVQQEITNGKGTVHALLKDSQMVVKLNTSLHNIEQGTAAFSENMEALKRNFLFRGYFRKLEKQKNKAEEKVKVVLAPN
jgi:phospholipid/cholesterol/gamma-HCH transport system substrate-binding protein